MPTAFRPMNVASVEEGTMHTATGVIKRYATLAFKAAGLIATVLLFGDVDTA